MNGELFNAVGIVGIGLIGGSLAKDIRTFGLARRILGWNRTRAHAERALELGLVDEVADEIEAVLEQCDLVVLAMPVNVLVIFWFLLLISPLNTTVMVFPLTAK